MAVIPTSFTTGGGRRCQDGLLIEYMKAYDSQESPSDFHLWTAVGLIAMALGRNAWYSRGAWNIYPNLYIVLVAESALARKSTALRLGIDPFKRAIPEIEGLGQKITPEALIGVLSDMCKQSDTAKAESYIYASEMSVLLGKTMLDDSLIKLLTDLWDCPDSHTYQTRMRGKEFLRDVCINMLAASTPDWLRNSVPAESLEGGFFSRLIIVNRPSTGEKNPFPEDTMSVHNLEALDNVIHDLREIRDGINGPFMWEPEGKRAYANWYCNYNEPENATSFMRGYYGRKGDLVLKLAMVSSANLSNTRVITKDDVTFAVSILNENEVFAKELVKFMGTTTSGKMLKLVLQKITSSVTDFENKDGTIQSIRGIAHSKLVQNTSHQLKLTELNEVLSSLLQSNEVEELLGGKSGTKRYYRKVGAE